MVWFCVFFFLLVSPYVWNVLQRYFIFFGLSMASAKNLMFFLVPVVGKLKMVCNWTVKFLHHLCQLEWLSIVGRWIDLCFVYAKWIVAMLMAIFYHQISDTLTFASIILLRFFFGFFRFCFDGYFVNVPNNYHHHQQQ